MEHIRFNCLFCEKEFNCKIALKEHVLKLHKVVNHSCLPECTSKVHYLTGFVFPAGQTSGEHQAERSNGHGRYSDEGSHPSLQNSSRSSVTGLKNPAHPFSNKIIEEVILDSSDEDSPESTNLKSVSVNPRCVTSSKNHLAHKLVAVTTSSAIHSLERQTVTVSSGTHQQALTIGTIAVVVSSNQLNFETILAQSDPPTSMPQQIVFNSGMSYVFLYLSPSTDASGSSPQFIVQESASGLVPSSDVTKVHSYSLASAAVSALSSSCDMQKVVISTPENHLQGTGSPHKAILTIPAQTQIRTGAKRLASVASSQSNTLSSVNTVIDIMSLLARVNELLSGLTSSSDARISSSPKSKIMDHFTKKLRLLKFKYYLQQAEYFFLKNGGGNIMDCLVSKKKLPIELLACLMSNKLDSYDDIEVITECLLRGCAISITASVSLKQSEEDDDDDDDEDIDMDMLLDEKDIVSLKQSEEDDDDDDDEDIDMDMLLDEKDIGKLTFRRNNVAPDIPDLKPKVSWLNGVEEGQGCKLGDIQEIRRRIINSKDVRNLYRVLFFQWPKNSQDIVGDILKFNGFTFDKSSYEYSKRQNFLKSLPDKTLFQICKLLGIRKGDKVLCVENLLDFLLNPSARIDPATDPRWQPAVLLERIKIVSLKQSEEDDDDDDDEDIDMDMLLDEKDIVSLKQSEEDDDDDDDEDIDMDMLLDEKDSVSLKQSEEDDDDDDDEDIDMDMLLDEKDIVSLKQSEEDDDDDDDEDIDMDMLLDEKDIDGNVCRYGE